LEEQVIFYFAFLAGMLVFLSMLSLGGEVRDIALEGEARALIKNLQDIVQEVKSQPTNYYASAEFQLPEKLGAKEYEARFLPGRVAIAVGSKRFDGEIDIANPERTSGGDLLLFYKQENSNRVFVQRK
jgi:hypothetical protein